MNVERIVVGPLGTNCYVLVDAGECLVIDPGAEAGRIARVVEELGAEVKTVVLTHGHVDHSSAAGALSDRFEAPVLVNRADMDMVNEPDPEFVYLLGGAYTPPKELSDLRPGGSLEVGETRLAVKHAPGHTQGSVVLLGPKAVFTGDLLFKGSVGRTDFPGGSASELAESLIREILPLSGDTIVYPGHGEESTVAEEKETNPFLDVERLERGLEV